MNDEAFISREEAIDFGKDYEYLMAAYYGLVFSFNDEIADFKISTNNNDFGDFDDVVIECSFQNGEEHVYALQLKHVVRPIAQVTLITNNKKFSLKKYSKEFQKAKTTCTKSRSYGAPFENFHFILFSNSALEKSEDVSEEWQKLEPIANNKKVESDIFIKRNANCLGKSLFSVSQKNEDFLYEFKSEKEGSLDAEFFNQFSFYTQQKDAKGMEALIAEIILKKFKNCDPSVALSYLNYFSYWCRRDFGTFKLTKENVRIKLAELILVPYIPQPDLEKMDYFPEDKIDLLHTLFLLFDVVLIDEESRDIINKVWSIVLKILSTLATEWSAPLSGVYIDLLVKKLEIPISAFSENFNEMSMKKLYVLLWHTGTVPMVVKIDKQLPCKEDILLAIELSANKGSKKRFILIDENSCFEPQSKWTVFKYLSDFASYSDIYTALIQDLSFSLQGRPLTSLQQLVEIDNNLTKFMTAKEVIHMVEDNTLIGRDCKNNFPKYYVKRTIPKVLLDIKAITEIEKDLFVVSDVCDVDESPSAINSIDLDKYLLLKQFGCHKDYIPKQVKISVLKKTEHQENVGERYFVLAKTGCTKQQFQEICSINPEKNCHHVRFIDGEKIEWLESHSITEEIQKYRLDSKAFKPEEFVDDKDALQYFKNTVNIICAEPGMGKSIMMNVLVFNCPADHWAIVVNLGEHAKFFKESHDIEEVLDYFLRMEGQTSLAGKIVSILSSRKQVIFLWDGFDEIPEECVDFVITAIKNLAKDGFTHWVAARSNSKKFLEDTFNTISLTLTEFSAQDQYYYVYSYLKERYDDEKVQEIIDQVNKNITKTLSCGYFDYTGIPLQLHMVVEIYLRKSRGESYDPITLTDIYQQFIRGKFDNLFEKAGADSDNHYMQDIRQEYSNAQLALYENAAMKSSFDKEYLVNLHLDCEELFEELDKGADNLGLIVRMTVDKTSIFSHKTYEEFLAASWLSKNYQAHSELVKILFEEKYSNVRLMFDMLLARDSPLHLAVLYRNLDILKIHAEDIQDCKDKGGRNVLHVACSWGRRHPIVKTAARDIEEATVDKSNEEMQQILSDLVNSTQTNSKNSKMTEFTTPVAVDTMKKIFDAPHQQEENSVSFDNTILIMNTAMLIKVDEEDSAYTEILKFLLTHKSDPFECDRLLRWNTFQYADQSLSLGALNLILEYHNIKMDDLSNYNDVPTLLHYSVVFSYDNLLKLITQIPYIEYKYPFGRLSLLQLASEANNLRAVEELSKHQAYKEVINVQSPLSGNLLTSAVFHGNIELMDILIENGAQVIGHKMPPLYAATLSRKFDCSKELLEAGADANETSSDGNCPLIMSVMVNEPDIAKLLLDHGADVDYVFKDLTALDCATNNLDTVKLLLQYKPDLNRQCEELGYTTLHLVSERGEVDTLKCLLEHGADTKIKSKTLLTPLHVAILNGKEPCAVELIKADPSVVNEYCSSGGSFRMSPIMLATSSNLPDIIRLLTKYGADVDATESSSSPLSYAASHNLDECLRALINCGASVNKRDKDGVIPLFVATNYLSTTKILLDNSADIKAKSNSGDTVLHFAAHGTDLGVVKELITRGADTSARNNQGWLPVYVAIASKNLEMAELLLSEIISSEDGDNLLGLAARQDFPEAVPFLLKRSIEVNSKDIHGMTPLHYACSYGNSCVQMLLDHGANANMVSDVSSPSLLLSCALSETNMTSRLITAGAQMGNFESIRPSHIAAMIGDIFSTVLLIRNGADVNALDKNGDAPLHYACNNNRLYTSAFENMSNKLSVYANFNKDDCARELIAKGASVNQKNHNGATPLHIACQNKYVNLVRLLVQNGADVNSLDNEGRSPLHICFVAERDLSGKCQLNQEILQILSDCGAKLDLQDDQGWTALFHACFVGDLGCVRLLIGKGADINAYTKEEHLTPIHVAAVKGYLEIVQVLLEHKADISIKHTSGNTVICNAAGFNHLDIFMVFAEEFGSNSNQSSEHNFVTESGYENLAKTHSNVISFVVDFGNEWTKSLQICASRGNLETLRYILESDLAGVNDKIEFVTALHNASYYGQYNVAIYLIENEANIDEEDSEGWTPLYYASLKGHLEMVKLLVSRNAQVDIANNHGNTALFVAASNGFLDIVEFLHENGADVNVVDADGDVPLHDAAYRGHLSVVKFLLSQKAHSKCRNKNGKTPLDVAIEQNRKDVVDLFKIFN